MGRAKVHPLTKFYKWKYSGLVVVPGSVLIIAILWFSYTSSLEFFDNYSCSTIKDYMMDIDVPSDVTPHNDLTEAQHLKLHALLDECIKYDRFSEPVKHDMP